ncbi:MAG: hypothetical protein WD711_02400 [Dongiaceae bacterium]
MAASPDRAEKRKALQTLSRRAALTRLGFASTAVYMVPVLATLSDARASAASQSRASYDLQHGSRPSNSAPSASNASGPSV